MGMISRMLLVTLTLVSTWMITAAQLDGSLLSRFLPKKTFTIHDTRFDQPVGRSSIAFRRPALRSPIRQVVSTNQRIPTFSQLPAVANQPSKGHNQPPLQQVSPQSYFPPGNGDRPQVPSRRPIVARPNSSAKPSRKHPKCGVLPPTGECRAAFPRYYYNSNTDQCDCYLYGGCGYGALAYGYQTLEACHASCFPSNLEEGPVCKEVFLEEEDEEVFFDPPAPSTHQQPNLDQISDDVLLSILVNSVSPEEFVTYDDTQEEQEDPNGRRNSVRYFY